MIRSISLKGANISRVWAVLRISIVASLVVPLGIAGGETGQAIAEPGTVTSAPEQAAVLVTVGGLEPGADGDAVSMAALANAGVSDANVKAIREGRIPQVAEVADPVATLDVAAGRSISAPDQRAAPAGSYDVLAKWYDNDARPVWYRRGYWNGTNGFGRTKIFVYHNLNMATVKVTTEHPRDTGSSGGRTRFYERYYVRLRCTGATCTPVDNDTVRVLVDYRDLGNGSTMGAVDGYCVRSRPRCMDWIKTAIN